MRLPGQKNLDPIYLKTFGPNNVIIFLLIKKKHTHTEDAGGKTQKESG